MRVPAHGVRMREPADESGQFAAPLRPHDQVPVVGHQTIAKEASRMRGQGLGEDAFESVVVGLFLNNGKRATARFKT